MYGAQGTIYANEKYQLQVDFPEHYPMEAPQVTSIDTYLGSKLLNWFIVMCFACYAYALFDEIQVIFLHPAPLHPHIYSNGHICLGEVFIYHLLTV